MATLGCAVIQSQSQMEADGTLTLYLHITDSIGHNISDIAMPGVNAASTDVTVNADIKVFVKNYMETNWGTVFGVLDTVRILFRLNSLT